MRKTMIPVFAAGALALSGCAMLGEALGGSAVRMVAQGILYHLCEPVQGSPDGGIVLRAVVLGLRCSSKDVVEIHVPPDHQQALAQAQALVVSQTFLARGLPRVPVTESLSAVAPDMTPPVQVITATAVVAGDEPRKFNRQKVAPSQRGPKWWEKIRFWRRR